MTVTTRIYDTYGEARRAADAVNALGLAGVEASLVGNEKLRIDHEVHTTPPVAEGTGAATGAGIGAALGGGAGLLAGLGVLAIPGLGPVVAAGWLAAAALGVAGGAVAGGAVGALTDLGVSEEDAPIYSEALRRGGILVSARYPAEREAEVMAALDRVPSPLITDRRRTYEADGWRLETEEERRRRLVEDTPVI